MQRVLGGAHSGGRWLPSPRPLPGLSCAEMCVHMWGCVPVKRCVHMRFAVLPSVSWGSFASSERGSEGACIWGFAEAADTPPLSAVRVSARWLSHSLARLSSAQALDSERRLLILLIYIFSVHGLFSSLCCHVQVVHLA